MFLFTPRQIQSIPTPLLWVGRRSGEHLDQGNANLLLESLVNILPLSRTESEPSNNAFLAMESMLVNGPQPRAQTDDGNATIVLQSLINVTPLSDTETDDSTASVALQSLINVTPVQQTINEDANAPTAAINLQSMIV